MRELFCASVLAVIFTLSARAQVVVLNDNMLSNRMSEVKTSVLDSLTSEPISFASVYVIPSKDTVITNFTLSDDKGSAKLEEVPFGSYVFHVEMMGYRPYTKHVYFRDRVVDMGTVRLQQDEKFLSAAVVSDVGNPIVIKKDTVEFSASSYQVGTNAMLKDLIRRMPGMEITVDGKVKFNGEAIDKLTVGGRTFFFNDQSAALNNLPAAVVDKIRVIDRASEESRATGVQDGSREKVLDVALKKEYEKGWFGNVGLKGGSTLSGRDEPLRDNRGLLFSGNALASAYSEKDQVTVIGNAQNIDDSGMTISILDDSGDFISLNQGLSTTAQIGVNANTSRIKDVETTVAANYKYADTDSGNRRERTTFQQDGDILSLQDNRGKQYSQSFTANAEMRKEKGDIWFHVSPQIKYGKTDTFGQTSSKTSSAGTSLNSSEGSTGDFSTSRSAALNSDLTFRNLFGTKGRSLRLYVSGGYEDKGGNSFENSVFRSTAGEESHDLRYLNDEKAYSAGGSLRYVEPLGDKWKLTAAAQLNFSKSDISRDASDMSGHNDFYSSLSNSRYIAQNYDLTAQYTFNERSFISLGAKTSGMLNETWSRSYGVAATTGEGEWNWFVAPTVDFQLNGDMQRVYFSVYGYNRRPSSGNMRPALDISNPSSLRVGNIYLRPSFTTSVSGSWSINNRERFSTMMLYWLGNVDSSPVTYAQWYDGTGTLYSIPVNSRRPGLIGQVNASYTTPLDKDKAWSLTLGLSATYASSTGYQSKGLLPGLDKEGFNYSTFMASFWGGPDGNRFYGGQSGFSENRTSTFGPNARIGVKYTGERFSFGLDAGSTGRISSYSLYPEISLKTFDNDINARGSYTTKHEFEFNTDLNYTFYNGYADGFGEPEWRWNVAVSKNIGAFSLSLTVRDILDSARSLSRSVSSNYVEDSYRLISGRHAMFGVKWNFGKMNAAHSRRAQEAAWGMAF